MDYPVSFTSSIFLLRKILWDITTFCLKITRLAVFITSNQTEIMEWICTAMGGECKDPDTISTDVSTISRCKGGGVF